MGFRCVYHLDTISFLATASIAYAVDIIKCFRSFFVYALIADNFLSIFRVFLIDFPRFTL